MERVTLIQFDDTFTTGNPEEFVKKIRLIYLALAAISTLLIQPMATSQADVSASNARESHEGVCGSDWNKINTTYYQKIRGETSYVKPSIAYSGCIVDANSP